MKLTKQVDSAGGGGDFVNLISTIPPQPNASKQLFPPQPQCFMNIKNRSVKSNSMATVYSIYCNLDQPIVSGPSHQGPVTIATELAALLRCQQDLDTAGRGTSDKQAGRGMPGTKKNHSYIVVVMRPGMSSR